MAKSKTTTRTPRRSPTPEELDRAVRLSMLPGATLAEASRTTGVSLSMLRKARKERPARLTRDDLILGALTKNGTILEGEVGDPGHLAAWLDYVNHDGSTAAEVERDLARLVSEGRLVIEENRFRLAGPWP